MYYIWHGLHGEVASVREAQVMQKTVGWTINHKRPDTVELSYKDVKALIEHPTYLKIMLGALKDGE